MRILIVAFEFPPYHVIGAVRPSKMAKYLLAQGHEVRVLTAADQTPPPTLPVEIPEELVLRTRWLDFGFGARVARKAFGGGAQRKGREGCRDGLRRILRTAYRWGWRSLLYPDPRAGWYPFAVRAGRELAQTWKPDLIYASAAPITPLFVARKLSRVLGVPWVAEFRDLWVGSHIYASVVPWYRRQIDPGVERRLLASASGLVLVSPLMAQTMADRYGRHAEGLECGFDPDDFRAPCHYPPAGERLRIVYTGNIYEGGYNLAPLMDALKLLGPAAEGLRVEFYGRNLHPVRAAAVAAGVSEFVETRDLIPYEASLKIQREADLLLLLGWNTPHDQGVLPQKLFEYLGARRPVLISGPQEDVAARILTSRGAATYLGGAEAIAAFLRAKLEEKQRTGAVAFTPTADLGDLSCPQLVRRLADYLADVVAGRAER